MPAGLPITAHTKRRPTTLARTPRKWQGARTPSGLKRVRQAERRHAILQPRRTAAKTLVAKAVTVATTQPEGADVAASLNQAISALDRAARKGAIHPNAAARRKSRLTRKVNAALGGSHVVRSSHVAKTTGKAAAAKAAKARIAAGKAAKAKGAQTAAGKARAALSKTARAETAAAAAAKPTAESTAPAKAPRTASKRTSAKSSSSKATAGGATKAGTKATAKTTAKTAGKATAKTTAKTAGKATAKASPASKGTTKAAADKPASRSRTKKTD
jgi:ribosomal protein S20